MNFSNLSKSLWKKHASPWSVWSRLLSTPLAYIPFWNHSWVQGLIVAVWFIVNPFLFPEPKNKENWATRAIKGERNWAKKRPIGVSMGIQTFGFIAFLGGFYTAYIQKLGLTVISALIVIACNLWFLDRMTDFKETGTKKKYGEN